MAERKFLVDLNFDQNEMQNAVVHTFASEPAAGIDGQLYYNTTDQFTYQYKAGGTNAWVVIGGSGTTNLSNTPSATEVTVESSSGSNTSILAATQSLAGVFSAADKIILDALDINAILWQDSNLLTGGPGASKADWFLDEDNMASDDDTKVASQQSIVAYVASQVAGGVTYKGAYNAATDTPALETTPGPLGILTGWMYTVTVAGTFFTEPLEIGDVLIAENDAPTTLAEWTIVQANLDGVVIGPSSAVNNNVALFDGTSGELIKDAGVSISGSNTGDEANASETVKGIVEEATQAEVDAGTDTGATGAQLFVVPSKLAAYSGLIGRHTETIGNGALTTFTINHAFGNQYVITQVFDETSELQVECQVAITDANNVTLDFNTAPTAAQYRVVVIG